ncbi:hypothetical protein QL285_009887 [Trifolium repens]|nr:hypothetical protein QL285_009887 [Trifolium repens]
MYFYLQQNPAAPSRTPYLPLLSSTNQGTFSLPLIYSLTDAPCVLELSSNPNDPKCAKEYNCLAQEIALFCFLLTFSPIPMVEQQTRVKYIADLGALAANSDSYEGVIAPKARDYNFLILWWYEGVIGSGAAGVWLMSCVIGFLRYPIL